MSQHITDIIIRSSGANTAVKSLHAIAASALSADRAVRNLQTGIKGFGLALFVRELLQLGDAYLLITNRIKAATHGTSDYTTVFRALHKISIETRSSIEANADVFQRLRVATNGLGISTGTVLKFQELLNKTLRVGGAGAQQQAAALLQLSQALASGALRGDEFRSVSENISFVLPLIAREMKVTVGELRFLAAQGKITTAVLINSFLKAEEQINATFKNTAPTLRDAFVQLRTEMVIFSGQAADTINGMQSLVSVVQLVASNLKQITEAVLFVTATFVAFKVATGAVFAFNFVSRMGQWNTALKTNAEQAVVAAAAKVSAAEAEIAANVKAGASLQTKSLLEYKAAQASAAAAAAERLTQTARKQTAEQTLLKTTGTSVEAANRAKLAKIEQNLISLRNVETAAILKQEAAIGSLASAQETLNVSTTAGLQKNIVLQEALMADAAVHLTQKKALIATETELATKRLIAAEAATAAAFSTHGAKSPITGVAIDAEVLARAQLNALEKEAIGINAALGRETEALKRFYFDRRAAGGAVLSVEQALAQSQTTLTALANRHIAIQSTLANTTTRNMLSAEQLAIAEAELLVIENQLFAAQARRLGMTEAQIAANVAATTSTEAQAAAVLAAGNSTKGLTAAQVGLAGATGAALSAAKNLGKSGPLLGGIFTTIRTAFVGLIAAIFGGLTPLGMLAIAIGIIGTAFLLFKDKVKLSGDVTITLGDIFRQAVKDTMDYTRALLGLEEAHKKVTVAETESEAMKRRKELPLLIERKKKEVTEFTKTGSVGAENGELVGSLTYYFKRLKLEAELAKMEEESIRRNEELKGTVISSNKAITDSYHKFKDSVDSTFKAQQDLSEALQIANDYGKVRMAQAKALADLVPGVTVTAQEMVHKELVRDISLANEKYQDQIHPIRAVNKALEDQIGKLKEENNLNKTRIETEKTILQYRKEGKINREDEPAVRKALKDADTIDQTNNVRAQQEVMDKLTSSLGKQENAYKKLVDGKKEIRKALELNKTSAEDLKVTYDGLVVTELNVVAMEEKLAVALHLDAGRWKRVSDEIRQRTTALQRTNREEQVHARFLDLSAVAEKEGYKAIGLTAMILAAKAEQEQKIVDRKAAGVGPLKEWNDELQRENILLGLNTRDQELYNQTMEQMTKLKGTSVGADLLSIPGLIQFLNTRREIKEVTSEYNKVLDKSSEALRTYELQMTAIQTAEERGRRGELGGIGPAEARALRNAANVDKTSALNTDTPFDDHIKGLKGEYEALLLVDKGQSKVFQTRKAIQSLQEKGNVISQMDIAIATAWAMSIDKVNDLDRLQTQFDNIVASTSQGAKASDVYADAQRKLNEALDNGGVVYGDHLLNQEDVNRILETIKFNLDKGAAAWREYAKSFAQQNAMMKLGTRELEVYNLALQHYNQLKQSGAYVDELSLAILAEKARRNRDGTEYQRKYNEVVEEGPNVLRDYTLGIRAVNQALEDNKITTEDANAKIRNLHITLLNTRRDFGSGLTSGLERLNDEYSNGAAQMEDALVGAFNSAEDALVNFLMTGENSFKAFADTVVESMIRITIQQTMMAPFTSWLNDTFQLGAQGLSGFGAGAASPEVEGIAGTVGQSATAASLASSAAALGVSSATLGTSAAALGTTALTAGTGFATAAATLTTAAGSLIAAATALGTAAGVSAGFNAADFASSVSSIAFASGGLTDGPVLFKMKGGKNGLMGEAGREAIMPTTSNNGPAMIHARLRGSESRVPLIRMSNGVLGVDLDGALGGSIKKYALGGITDGLDHYTPQAPSGPSGRGSGDITIHQSFDIKIESASSGGQGRAASEIDMKAVNILTKRIRQEAKEGVKEVLVDQSKPGNMLNDRSW